MSAHQSCQWSSGSQCDRSSQAVISVKTNETQADIYSVCADGKLHGYQVKPNTVLMTIGIKWNLQQEFIVWFISYEVLHHTLYGHCQRYKNKSGVRSISGHAFGLGKFHPTWHLLWDF